MRKISSCLQLHHITLSTWSKMISIFCSLSIDRIVKAKELSLELIFFFNFWWGKNFWYFSSIHRIEKKKEFKVCSKSSNYLHTKTKWFEIENDRIRFFFVFFFSMIILMVIIVVVLMVVVRTKLWRWWLHSN